MVRNIVNWLFSAEAYQSSWLGQNVFATKTGVGAVFLIALIVAAGAIVFSKKFRNIFF